MHTPADTTLGMVTATDARVTQVEQELEAARLLADMATGYVVNVRSLDQSRTLTDQLTHALDSRVIIEQAKGLIAGRHGVDVDDAFDLLREYARRERKTLHEVCRQVLDRSADI